MEQKEGFCGLYTDRYELAMAAAYWRADRAEETACFDYSFRSLPFGGGFAVFAGLATLVERLRDFRYSPAQLDFLERDGFERAFLEHLAGFRFRGSVRAPREGEPVFPGEPVATIEGGLLECQLVETLVLNVLNFQTLVATKAARCRLAAGKRLLSEFGLRRSHGQGGLWASRAAIVGGFDTTSNMEAAFREGLPAAGTMAHAFVQSYDSELEAFRAYAREHGSKTALLLDTYDTLGSGLPNAIKVARELETQGAALAGVRLDSGDLGALAGKVRRELDAAGLEGVKIAVSDRLDERVIARLVGEGAPIDFFGVGTALATGRPDAALDGVYKLALCGGKPRLKASETPEKATLPGRKTVWRYADADGVYRADLIALAEDPNPPATVAVMPEELRGASLAETELLRAVVADGEPVEPLPSATEAAAYAREALDKLPAECKDLERPADYFVDVSEALNALRKECLEALQPEKSKSEGKRNAK